MMMSRNRGGAAKSFFLHKLNGENGTRRYRAGTAVNGKKSPERGGWGPRDTIVPFCRNTLIVSTRVCERNMCFPECRSIRPAVAQPRRFVPELDGTLMSSRRKRARISHTRAKRIASTQQRLKCTIFRTQGFCHAPVSNVNGNE
jgi:hypothetical protein